MEIFHLDDPCLKSLKRKNENSIHPYKSSSIILLLFAKGHGVMIRVNVAKAGALMANFGNSPWVMNP